jgi:hypothetical protein
MSALSLAFGAAAVYVLANGDFGSTYGIPTWVFPAAVVIAAFAWTQSYVLNVRRPRAIRLTPDAIEVRTLFGGLVRVPREGARVWPSGPSRFGYLRIPTRRTWVVLSPIQLSYLWKELHPTPDSSVRS